MTRGGDQKVNGSLTPREVTFGFRFVFDVFEQRFPFFRQERVKKDVRICPVDVLDHVSHSSPGGLVIGLDVETYCRVKGVHKICSVVVDEVGRSFHGTPHIGS